MKDNRTVDFIDEKGHESTIIFEGEQYSSIPKKKYKLQSPIKTKKFNKKLAKGIFTSDIAIHSSGFAGIMGLALIISIAGIIIAYLVLRF